MLGLHGLCHSKLGEKRNGGVEGTGCVCVCVWGGGLYSVERRLRTTTSLYNMHISISSPPPLFDTDIRHFAHGRLSECGHHKYSGLLYCSIVHRSHQRTTTL